MGAMCGKVESSSTTNTNQTSSLLNPNQSKQNSRMMSVTVELKTNKIICEIDTMLELLPWEKKEEVPGVFERRG